MVKTRVKKRIDVETVYRKNPIFGPQLQNIAENVSSPGILVSRLLSPIKPPSPISVSSDIATENIRSEPMNASRATSNDE